MARLSNSAAKKHEPRIHVVGENVQAHKPSTLPCFLISVRFHRLVDVSYYRLGFFERKDIMENGNSSARDPSGFLTQIIGGKVTVKLNSGVVYKGNVALYHLRFDLSSY